MGSFWHPFADMAAVEAGGELVVDRGQGIHVWDAQGRRYLDATASLWYCNVGYGRDEIADAASAQMRRLSAYSTFGDLANHPAVELAARVGGLAPVEGSKVFFTSGGSDSIDTATKMARRYWQLLGQTDRTILITRERAYHGMHIAGTSLAGIEANVAGYGTFVADEVITGFGRLGDWFASSRFDLQPDLIACAKGITSGYLPMGAVIAAPWVAEPFWSPGTGMWRHGYTYAGHATVAAAALANLDIIERENLTGRALQLEKELAEALTPLAAHELVDEVRAGTGVMAAVQLAAEAVGEDPGLPLRAVAACRQAGIMTRTLATGALHISPALVIDHAGLEELVSGIRAALDACA